MAVAVTSVTPAPCGVQTRPKVSHLPAQARLPADGTKLRTLGLLEVNTIGAVEEGTSVALNCSVDPRSMLLALGASLTCVGVGVGAVPMGLLLPQPLRLAKHKDMEKTAKTREANRRMHPPRRGELLAVRRVY